MMLRLTGIAGTSPLVVATMNGPTMYQEMMDYRDSEKVVVELRLNGLSEVNATAQRIPRDPLLNRVMLQAECFSIQKQGIATSRVSVNGPRREAVALSYEAVMRNGVTSFTGEKVEWEGRILKILRYGSNTHVVIEPTGRYRNFVAYSPTASFVDELADYNEDRGQARGDQVVVTGTIRESRRLPIQLDSSPVLVEIDSLRRVGDPDSLAVPGKARSPGSFRSTLSRSPMELLLRNVPGPGESRQIQATFQFYSEYSREVQLRTSENGPQGAFLRVAFPYTTKADFADYVNGAEVLVEVSLPRLPDNFRYSGSIQWEGVSLVRTQNRHSRITSAGRLEPVPSVEAESTAWRSRTRDRRGVFVAYGQYGGYSITGEQPKVKFTNLFWNAYGSATVAIGGLDLVKQLDTLRVGDDVRFTIQHDRSRFTDDGQLLTVERLDDGIRLQFPEVLDAPSPSTSPMSPSLRRRP